MEGDILLPENFYDELIASNVPITAIDTAAIENRDLLAELDTQYATYTNVDLDAQSGNMHITNNTSAKGARSEDASAGGSISNIANSQFSLADWLGALLSNVRGSCHASFGIDTQWASNIRNKTEH